MSVVMLILGHLPDQLVSKKFKLARLLIIKKLVDVDSNFRIDFVLGCSACLLGAHAKDFLMEARFQLGLGLVEFRKFCLDG